MPFKIGLREVVGGKPAKTGADVPLLQKSDRRKLLLQLCGITAFGRGLGAEDRRRSRHAQIIIFFVPLPHQKKMQPS